MLHDALAGYSYEQEDGITWLEDSGGPRYVREALVLCRFRARQPHAAPETHLVAFATLRPDARPERTHRFVRRVWYAIPEDAVGPLPLDAVDPGSIQPRLPTPRADGAPAPLIPSEDFGTMLEVVGGGVTVAEAEAPGLAFRVKRVSVPCEPLAAAAALRRHFTADELRELAAALTCSAQTVDQRQTA